MLLRENDKLVYVAESRVVPENNQLWIKAKQIARMDKDFKANTAMIIAKRVYQMMGGSFKRKKK
jgi:hypothetical protein